MHPAQQDSSDSDSEDYYYDAVEEADPSMYIPYQTAERPNIDELATAVADRLSYGDRWRRRRLDGVYQLDDNLAPDEWYNENYSDDDCKRTSFMFFCFVFCFVFILARLTDH